jgi:hypothetical protein
VRTHEDYTPRIAPRMSSDRSFGWVFTAFFVVVGCLPLRHHRPVHIWALVVSGGLLAITLTRPSLLHFGNVAWRRLGLLLGAVVNPIVMGVLFFGVVTPMALLMRWMSKDVLRLRWDAQVRTYWLPRQPPGPDPKTMINQF